MIRRDFTFENGTAGWLLISQVEHARISGELTAAWSEPFSAEVIDAITHHDDGWSKWETMPEMDPHRGRPLSFLELDVADATCIWEASIESARKFGPLAGGIVAGHFIGLARGSEHASQSPVREWLVASAATRDRWLGEWLANGANTAAEADRAQQMLYVADLLSLWLCLDGPVAAADDERAEPNTEMQARSTRVLGTYHIAEQSNTLTETLLDWNGSISPWPFFAHEIHLLTPALAVPVKNYPNWPSISAAARPFELRWQLAKEVAPRD